MEKNTQSFRNASFSRNHLQMCDKPLQDKSWNEISFLSSLAGFNSDCFTLLLSKCLQEHCVRLSLQRNLSSSCPETHLTIAHRQRLAGTVSKCASKAEEVDVHSVVRKRTGSFGFDKRRNLFIKTLNVQGANAHSNTSTNLNSVMCII